MSVPSVVINCSKINSSWRFECSSIGGGMPFQLHLKASSPLSKLFDAFRERQRLSAEEQVAFVFENDEVAAAQTATDLELKVGDELHVYIGDAEKPEPESDENPTALMAACGQRNARRVRKLLKAGASPNDYWADGGAGPMSALSVAVESWSVDLEIVRILLDAGGDPNSHAGEVGTIYEWVLEYKLGGNQHDKLARMLRAAGGGSDAAHFVYARGENVA